MRLNCKLQQIGKALRKATGRSELFEANNFHEEISKLCHVADDVNGHIPTFDGKEIVPTIGKTVIKGNQYLRDDLVIRGDKAMPRQFNAPEWLNEYYGCLVADVARSYHLAKTNGTAVFRYSQSKGIMATSELLTDEEGRCWLDCSSFVGLVLRGIEFKDTPYWKAKGEPFRHLSDYGLSKKVIYDLCQSSKHTWANKYLDLQTDSSLRNIGVCNHYSIRNAAQIAEYYYNNGKVLYDFKESPTTTPGGLKPGDLIFWAKDGASDIQKDRFRAISHIGIVARDTAKYYQVTGYSDERVTDTVFYSAISTNLEFITMIIRPNYVPIKEEVPPFINLVSQYHFDSCQVGSSMTKYGVKFTPQAESGFTIERVEANTNGATFYIINDDDPIRLQKGTYKISGTPVCESASTNPEVRDWGLAIKTMSGDNLAWDKGTGVTFTITKDTKVYFYFYVGKSITTTEPLLSKPKLERIG